MTQYRTTSGSIYIQNLNATINSLLQVGADKPGSARAGALAGSLYHRFQILGRISDGEQALALLDRIPDDVIDIRTQRQRAILRTGYHRFDEALTDLNAASSKGRPLNSDDPSLRGIALARGDYASIRDDFAKAGEPSEKFAELVLRGNLAALEGDLSIASLQFYRAQSVYSDSSPYQLAWLYAQQGIALERFGFCDKARVFFDAAIERLPGYALALDHLGECLLWEGQLDAARPIYAQLIEQTGNPEYLGAMAVLEVEAGNAGRGEDYRKRAIAGYQHILDLESVTWSQHAAEFYLAIDDPKQALVQARNNLDNRNDVLSLMLFARVAHANDMDREACDALRKIQASGLRPPEIERWKGQLPRSCASTLPATSG
ncbi:MAG TPA: tetratricopeptide repeat protein [Dokdonella sp.]|uniref:tetratricopeptide repeat protein n=1 Tax=Dokdonella sp. TaxID=2291710 RepID=UPI002D7F77F9|nr:tetratricopeptide repeat protein [Dokdonella sp.]HET9031779.1 tetratricopeptide repeat protein [Dokdonella sp.]